MTPRQKRLAWVASGIVIVAAVVSLLLYALNSNIVFFYSPSQVAANEAPAGRAFRLGGLVEPGSVRRDGTRVQFRVTDGDHTIDVHYVGTLPDLFREGKGVVAQGRIEDDGRFRATEVLAKHDENYMPPEAAEALEKAGHPASVKTLEQP